jgi:hypothetical protein
MILDNAEVWGAHKQEKLTRIRILERRNDDDRNCNVPSTTNIADEHPDEARLPSVTSTNQLHAVERSLDYKSIELVKTSSTKVLGSDVKLGQCVDRRGESILAGREKKMQTNKDKKHNLPTSSPDSNFMQPTLLHSYFLLPNSSSLPYSRHQLIVATLCPSSLVDSKIQSLGTPNFVLTPTLLLFMARQVLDKTSMPSQESQNSSEVPGSKQSLDKLAERMIGVMMMKEKKVSVKQNDEGKECNVPAPPPKPTLTTDILIMEPRDLDERAVQPFGSRTDTKPDSQTADHQAMQTNASPSTPTFGMQTADWRAPSVTSFNLPLSGNLNSLRSSLPRFLTLSPASSLTSIAQLLDEAAMPFQVIQGNIEVLEGNGQELSVDKLEKLNRMTKKTNEWASEKPMEIDKKLDILVSFSNLTLPTTSLGQMDTVALSFSTSWQMYESWSTTRTTLPVPTSPIPCLASTSPAIESQFRSPTPSSRSSLTQALSSLLLAQPTFVTAMLPFTNVKKISYLDQTSIPPRVVQDDNEVSGGDRQEELGMNRKSEGLILIRKRKGRWC